jgi:hypothetical protein
LRTLPIFRVHPLHTSLHGCNATTAPENSKK